MPEEILHETVFLELIARGTCFLFSDYCKVSSQRPEVVKNMKKINLALQADNLDSHSVQMQAHQAVINLFAAAYEGYPVRPRLNALTSDEAFSKLPRDSKLRVIVAKANDILANKEYLDESLKNERSTKGWKPNSGITAAEVSLMDVQVQDFKKMLEEVPKSNRFGGLTSEAKKAEDAEKQHIEEVPKSGRFGGLTSEAKKAVHAEKQQKKDERVAKLLAHHQEHLKRIEQAGYTLSPQTEPADRALAFKKLQEISLLWKARTLPDDYIPPLLDRTIQKVIQAESLGIVNRHQALAEFKDSELDRRILARGTKDQASGSYYS